MVACCVCVVASNVALCVRPEGNIGNVALFVRPEGNNSLTGRVDSRYVSTIP